MCCVRERWMLSKDLCCRYTSRMLAEGWLLSQELQSAIPCRCFLSLLPLSLPDAPPSSSLICVTPRLKCKQVCLLLLTIFPPPIHMTKYNRSMMHTWGTDRKSLDPWIASWKTYCPPEVKALHYYVWARNIFYCVDTVSLEFTPQPVGFIN